MTEDDKQKRSELPQEPDAASSVDALDGNIRSNEVATVDAELQDSGEAKDSSDKTSEKSETPSTANDADATASDTDIPSAKIRRRFPWGMLLLTVLLLLLTGAVAVTGWYGYQWLEKNQQGTSVFAEQQQQLQSQLNQQAQAIELLQRSRSEVASQFQQQSRDLQERVQVLEQRVVAQNKRLLAMSTITREDWLLAEAEYLLKLANQRILIEHSATGAESLLAEADNILRDLEDPDIFPLRKAVKNDLAALRLVEKVDVEGIYLEIDGLINQLAVLPIKPNRQEVMGSEQADQPASPGEGWRSRLKHSFNRFTHTLGQYIRVRDHSVEAKALLAPETAQYLMQNVRLILERAQLALLREQPAIYEQSLQQAGAYIKKFYPESNAASRYRQELQLLSERDIVRQLPDITPSLELLHSYIEQLHQLQGAKPVEQGAR